MHHLSTAFQKPMMHKLTIQKIRTLSCQCTIYLNTTKIIEKITGSLWNYYRDEASNPLSSSSESFKYNTSITGDTYDGDDDADKVVKNETELVIPQAIFGEL